MTNILTVEEAQNRNIISKNLKIEEIKDICRTMGIDIVDIHSQIDADKWLDRLQYSSAYHKINAKNEMQNFHSSVIGRYNELIKNYTTVRDNMPNTPEFQSEKNAIDTIINGITAERDSYQNEIQNFDYKNINQYFNYDSGSRVINGINEIGSSRSHNLESKSKTVSTKLSRLYRNEEVLLQNQARTRSTTAKISNQIKIQRIQRKINRLRKKQGRIDSNQRTVIARNTELYVSRMDRRFDLYAKEFNRINDTIEDKKASYFELNQLQQEISDANDLNSALNNERALQGRIGRFITDREIKSNRKNLDRLQERVNLLNNKYGNVDVMQQYNEVVNRQHYVR